MNFSAMALIYERPFLGILYSWVSTVARSGVLTARLPWAVAFTLKWISDKVNGEGRTMRAPDVPLASSIDWFRSDAKATDTQAWVGGWELPISGKSTDARWFAFEVTKEHYGWAFAKGSPKKAIAALEMLASLVSLKLFYKPGTDKAPRNCFVTASTDNKGNSFIIQKMMTTKYPGLLVLMEMAEELRSYNSTLELTWLPRESNVEADALTNGDYSGFNLSLRIPADYDKIGWRILPLLQDSALSLYKEISDHKSSATTVSKGGIAAGKFSKRSNKNKLKWRDPW